MGAHPLDHENQSHTDYSNDHRAKTQGHTDLVFRKGFLRQGLDVILQENSG